MGRVEAEALASSAFSPLFLTVSSNGSGCCLRELFTRFGHGPWLGVRVVCGGAVAAQTQVCSRIRLGTIGVLSSPQSLSSHDLQVASGFFFFLGRACTACIAHLFKAIFSRVD